MDKSANLIGKNLPQLSDILSNAGYQNVNPSLLAHTLYKKFGRPLSSIATYPKSLRQFLEENFSTDVLQPILKLQSTDGTIKGLFENEEGKLFEAAWIPAVKRMTICVSSQAGCRFGCKFCSTGQNGFKGNLSVYEILSQIFGLQKPFNHIVYMGMGEPLDNFANVKKSIDILTAWWGVSLAHRYVTISTVGLIPELQLAIEQLRCNLAISLHSPFHNERKSIMPVENIYPIHEVISMLKAQKFTPKRRLSFEYLLIKDFNDSKFHAMETGKLLKNMESHVNLIVYNPIPSQNFGAPDTSTIENFRKILNLQGLRVTIRKSSGYDISAACGMMTASR
ncbi:MAG: 23S rRNA (adenine(2503)-C(2))-methyltransferase RlmN [Lentimicrobium sp.]